MSNIARCIFCGAQIEYEGIFVPPKKCSKCYEKTLVKIHHEPLMTKEDIKKELESEDWRQYQSICDQLFNQIKSSHYWVEQEYENLKKCIEVYPTLEKGAIDFKYRVFDGIDELRDHHVKQMKEIEKLTAQMAEKNKMIDNYGDESEKIVLENADLAFKLADKDKEVLQLKQENMYLKTMLNMKYGKYGDVRLDILHRLRDKFEDIFDKALNNCSVNEKYYDQILDEIDKEIHQITGGVI